MQAKLTVRLVKQEPGFYLVEGTTWAIGRTDDLIEGPRGGSYSAWELRYRDNRGWVIDSTPAFRTLRDARRYIEANPSAIMSRDP